MKIGLVCPYSIAKSGGVQEHVFAQATELRRRGHEVFIITPHPKGHEAPPDTHTIFVGSATDINSPVGTTFQVSAGVNELIDEMLAREQFDVIHFHEPWIPMLSLQILSRSKAVHVATFHGKLPESIVSRTMARAITPYTRSVLKYIHEFTAVSEAAAEYLRQLSDKPIALIPNGIDLDFFKAPRSRKENKEKTIFFVGRLEQRKGVKYLIRAFAELIKSDPHVKLIIGGDGPEREKLEDLVETLELTQVQFLGRISDEDKLHHLKTADVFCSPALYGESFGIVLLEAMATGTVTVAGNNPGYSTVMTGVGALSLVSPKDTLEFARRLELLLHEPALRALWRDWAASQLPQYSYKKIVDQYVEVYKDAVKRHA